MTTSTTPAPDPLDGFTFDEETGHFVLLNNPYRAINTGKVKVGTRTLRKRDYTEEYIAYCPDGIKEDMADYSGLPQLNDPYTGDQIALAEEFSFKPVDGREDCVIWSVHYVYDGDKAGAGSTGGSGTAKETAEQWTLEPAAIQWGVWEEERAVQSAYDVVPAEGGSLNGMYNFREAGFVNPVPPMNSTGQNAFTPTITETKSFPKITITRLESTFSTEMLKFIGCYNESITTIAGFLVTVPGMALIKSITASSEYKKITSQMGSNQSGMVRLYRVTYEIWFKYPSAISFLDTNTTDFIADKVADVGVIDVDGKPWPGVGMYAIDNKTEGEMAELIGRVDDSGTAHPLDGAGKFLKNSEVLDGHYQYKYFNYRTGKDFNLLKLPTSDPGYVFIGDGATTVVPGV